jgi:hypothetical protein
MRISIAVASRWLLIAGTATLLSGCYETTGNVLSPMSTASIDAQGQGQRYAPQAGRGTRAPAIPEAASPPEYLTAERAKTECWMQAETDKKAPKDLEKRSKWVEKCASAKMRDQATQWANSGPAPTNQVPQPTSFPNLPVSPTAPPPVETPDITKNGL